MLGLIYRRRHHTVPPYLQFTTQPGGANSGSAFSPQPVVTAKNPDGTTKTSFTGNVTLAVNTVSGSHSLGGTVTVAAVAGVATFSGVTDTGSGNGTLTATATGYSSATSASFTTAAGGGGTTAILAHTAAGSTDSNSVTTTAIDTTGAKLLVVAVSSDNPSTATLTDSKSNGWTAFTQQVAGGVRLQGYYCINPTVGAGHTFTVGSSATFASVAVAAFSNVITPLDGQIGANNSGGGASTTIQPGSLTPSANNGLLVALLAKSTPNTETATINGGFTIADQVPYSSGSHYGVALAYLIQTTAAAANPTWTVSTATVMGTTLAAFKNG